MAEDREMGGIEFKVAIIDYGDRDEDGEPKTYYHNTRLTEFEIARTGDRGLVEQLSDQAIQNVIMGWREKDD